MATAILVRHGRTPANVNGVLAGWSPGVMLDEHGQTQAAAVAERLRALPLAALVASPLDRTQQTADAILAVRDAEVPRYVDERLGEVRYGDWTGRPLAKLAKEPMWQVVQAHPSAAVFPGAEGESMAAMQHRAVGAIREWNSRFGADAMYVVVSHGDVIKSIIADALGMHLDAFQRIRVDPCSVSVIDYTPLRPFVLRTNDSGSDLSALAGGKSGQPAKAGKPAKSGKKRRGAEASSDAVVGGGAG